MLKKTMIGLFILLIIVSGTHVFASENVTRARNLEDRGDLLGALKQYKQAFETVVEPAELDGLNKKIENIKIKILFSNIVDKDSIEYIVKPGDALSRIAKKYNTTVDLIKRSNNLSSDMIRIGDKLKIVTVAFSVFVDKSQNVLFLKRGEDILKTYRVATGLDNGTPTGEFYIKTKLKDPVHFRKDIRAAVPPGSDKNILGTRWLGFEIPGYGIHGHAVPEDLGNQVTLGCVRMLNNEVEELFVILPRGAKVTVVD